jgi:hypothetical protein
MGVEIYVIKKKRKKVTAGIIYAGKNHLISLSE